MGRNEIENATSVLLLGARKEKSIPFSLGVRKKIGDSRGGRNEKCENENSDNKLKPTIPTGAWQDSLTHGIISCLLRS